MKKKTLKNTLGAVMSFLTLGNIVYATTNYTLQQQKKESQVQKQMIKPMPKLPIFYQERKVKDKETGEIITKISRDIAKAYLLELTQIYEITVGEGDKISYWMIDETWAPGEQHDKTKLVNKILEILNGKGFDPDKLDIGQKIYLVDLDKNGVIRISEKQGKEEKRGRNLTPDEALYVINQKEKSGLEKKLDKNVR